MESSSYNLCFYCFEVLITLQLSQLIGTFDINCKHRQSNKINIHCPMFNRQLYEKMEKDLETKTRIQKQKQVFQIQRKKRSEIEVARYKSKVRDFLVEIATNPMDIGQYQPPVKTITRSIKDNHLLGAPQMFINGFKTNKQRVQRTFEENRRVDYSPTTRPALLHNFRERDLQNQIQPGLRFASQASLAWSKKKARETYPFDHSSVKNSRHSKSLTKTKFPSIVNPEKKTYFKAVEEMGNSLKCMEQTKDERMGLANRLMTVLDGKEINIENTAMDVLADCKLLKRRVNSEKYLRSSASMQLTKGKNA